jgi:hypothetical protein
MAQITWRNINNPNFTGGNEAIESGNELLLSGINQLAKVGGNLEQRQRDENTSAALDQIKQLDQSGLQEALTTPGFIPTDQNIDVNALRDALSGQQGVIDAKAQADFNRQNLITSRKDAPIEASLEHAKANRTLSKELIENSDASPKLKARYLNELRQTTREDIEQSDKDKVRNRRIANEGDLDYTSNIVTGSETEILNEMIKPDGNVDGLIQSILNKAKTDRKGTWEPHEARALGEALQSIANPTFTAATQQRLEDDIEISNLGIQQEHDALETNFNRITELANKSNVTTDVNSPEEQEALGNFFDELDKSHGNESWIPSFKGDDAEAGLDLKQDLEELRQEGGYSVASLRAAMKIHSQSESEGFGEPDVYMQKIRDTLEDWSSNSSIAKTAQLAVELVPPLKSNSKRDILAYNQSVATMQKSLQGKKGKEKLNRLLKAKEAQVTNSRNSLREKQIRARQAATANLMKSLSQ